MQNHERLTDAVIEILGFDSLDHTVEDMDDPGPWLEQHQDWAIATANMMREIISALAQARDLTN